MAAISSTLRYLNINGAEMLVRVEVDEQRVTDCALEVDCTFEILDVLSPPAARAKWLEEKGK